MMMGLWRLAGLGMQKRFFSKSSAALERGRRSSGPLSISSLTGRLKQDGLTRYELDFMETAEWSIALVERMKNDYKELSGGISALGVCSNISRWT